jgi:hypothetical protein
MTKSQNRCPKLHQMRAYIKMDMIPYMHLLDPLALCISRFKG